MPRTSDRIEEVRQRLAAMDIPKTKAGKIALLRSKAVELQAFPEQTRMASPSERSTLLREYQVKRREFQLLKHKLRMDHMQEQVKQREARNGEGKPKP